VALPVSLLKVKVTSDIVPVELIKKNAIHYLRVIPCGFDAIIV
jgi:hypothetical protein